MPKTSNPPRDFQSLARKRKRQMIENNGSVPQIPEDEMARQREELFTRGSTFLPTSADQIVGIDNILMEIDDVIHWLKYAPLYQKYNSRLEPGIVFEGEPGTGKTLVSRYIATESNALFISVRDWPHNQAFLNDSDISALFRLARETYANTKKPIVLFWDEFEGNAMERVNASVEQASAVAQLTAELDGVHGKNEGILLIGCTNYFHSIDHALLRSGRMGLQIEFHAPDREGKAALLEYYLGMSVVKGKIDIEMLSYLFSTGTTAADIEEACVEAWRYAVRRMIEDGSESPMLSQADLMKVFVKRLVGPPTAFVNLPEENRRIVALHETGHALTALIYGVPVRLITVQPGKNSLGRVITAEVEEHVGTQEDIVNVLRTGLGACAAESAAGLSPTVAGASDLSNANHLAAKLVDQLNYGSETGLFSVISLSDSRGRMSDMGETLAPSVADETILRSDREVYELLRRIERETSATMNYIGKEVLWELADEVNRRITLTGAEFTEIAKEILKSDDLSRFRAWRLPVFSIVA